MSGEQAAVVACDVPVLGHRGQLGLSQHQPARFSALDVEARREEVWR